MARQKSSSPTRKMKVQGLAAALVTAIGGVGAMLGWFEWSPEQIDAWTVLIAAVLMGVLPMLPAWTTKPNPRDQVITSRSEKLSQS